MIASAAFEIFASKSPPLKRRATAVVYFYFCLVQYPQAKACATGLLKEDWEAFRRLVLRRIVIRGDLARLRWSRRWMCRRCGSAN